MCVCVCVCVCVCSVGLLNVPRGPAARLRTLRLRQVEGVAQIGRIRIDGGDRAAGDGAQTADRQRHVLEHRLPVPRHRLREEGGF